jgi:hypothetical protein
MVAKCAGDLEGNMVDLVSMESTEHYRRPGYFQDECVGFLKTAFFFSLPSVSQGSDDRFSRPPGKEPSAEIKKFSHPIKKPEGSSYGTHQASTGMRHPEYTEGRSSS